MSEDARIGLLRRVAVFDELSHVQLARLAERCELRTFDEGMALLGEGQMGDGLYVVVRGRVALAERIESERERRMLKLLNREPEVVQTLCGPGESFGELDLVDPAASAATARALEATECLFLSATKFAAEAAADPVLAIRLLPALARRVRAAERRAVQLAMRPPAGGQLTGGL